MELSPVHLEHLVRKQDAVICSTDGKHTCQHSNFLLESGKTKTSKSYRVTSLHRGGGIFLNTAWQADIMHHISGYRGLAKN